MRAMRFKSADEGRDQHDLDRRFLEGGGGIFGNLDLQGLDLVGQREGAKALLFLIEQLEPPGHGEDRRAVRRRGKISNVRFTSHVGSKF
jgi:hypothetical protein